MLVENTVNGVVDRVNDAIYLLQQLEPPEGYYVGFSGGKDSCVILDLVKRAGVKFEAYHHYITIEPPELLKFIATEYPEVIMIRPKDNMYNLIVKNGMPPLRHTRYCHRILKSGGNNRVKILGVRAAESSRRAHKRRIEQPIHGKGMIINLIVDWSTSDVWEYIHTYNVKYCELYDRGRTRIGCLFCPFASKSQINEDLKLYPQIANYLIKACDKAIQVHRAKGKIMNFKDGADMFYWWINRDRSKPKRGKPTENLDLFSFR